MWSVNKFTLLQILLFKKVLPTPLYLFPLVNPICSLYINRGYVGFYQNLKKEKGVNVMFWLIQFTWILMLERLFRYLNPKKGSSSDLFGGCFYSAILILLGAGTIVVGPANWDRWLLFLFNCAYILAHATIFLNNKKNTRKSFLHNTLGLVPILITSFLMYMPEWLI